MIQASTSVVIPGGTHEPQAIQAVPITISIIIVNYNAGHYLEKCLASLYETVPAGCEIILVDNNSADNSVQYVTSTYPMTHIIQNNENPGYGGGNNIGARYSRGEYLIFLNPDTITTTGWLEALIRPLAQNPQIGMTTSRILLMSNPDAVNACGNDTHFSGLTLCRGMNDQAAKFETLSTVGAVSGAAFAMRKRDFEALGGFDETLFLYMEDTDLSWRVRLAGYDCVFTPESIVYHDYQLKFGVRKIYYQEFHRYVMLLKCFHWVTLLLLLPALLLAELVTWGFVLLREPHSSKNKLQAYRSVWENWRTIRILREQVQSSRQISDRQLLAGCTHRIAFEQTGRSRPAQMANILFNPLFWLYHQLMLIIARW